VGRRFRVELKGDEARLGQVPAGDVARLLLGVERALARQSAQIVGRPLTGVGRWEAVIANAAHVRLAGLEEGSIVPVLDLPDFGVDGLALQAETLGETALNQLLDVVAGLRPAAPEVAAALVGTADELGVGSRYESFVFDYSNGGGRRRVIVDPPARDRLRAVIDRPTERRQEAVRGTLVEADFEKSTARLRTPTGQALTVSFQPELSDAIEEALRRPAEFAGEVAYDPATAAATSISLREVHSQPKLWQAVESEDFWQPQSLAALQQSGAVRPVESASELHVQGSQDGDDVDAFFAALAE